MIALWFINACTPCLPKNCTMLVCRVIVVAAMPASTKLRWSKGLHLSCVTQLGGREAIDFAFGGKVVPESTFSSICILVAGSTM